MRTLDDFLKDQCVRMNNSNKSVNSAAIKGEIKRHESLQNTINRLSKQLERVPDQQLRSGLKVYLHSIQGKQMESTWFPVDVMINSLSEQDSQDVPLRTNRKVHDSVKGGDVMSSAFTLWLQFDLPEFKGS